MVEAETKIKSELISSEDGSKGVKDCFLYMKKQEKFEGKKTMLQSKR